MPSFCRTMQPVTSQQGAYHPFCATPLLLAHASDSMHVTSRVDSARIRLIDSFRCIMHQLTHSKAIYASPYLISPMFPRRHLCHVRSQASDLQIAALAADHVILALAILQRLGDGHMRCLLRVQAYYGKLDAETVTRYGLQCAMNNYQSSNRSRDIFMVFKQACT